MTDTHPRGFRLSPHSAFRVPHSTLLLLGPTGSGKTPLGEFLEAHGLCGRRCLHFDFGANLRRVAEGSFEGLRTEDIAVVRDSLATGALLEKETFRIATGILSLFLSGHGGGECDWLILNGLPRHVDQAQDVDGIVDVRLVVFLDCAATVVAERIRCNSGGDRDDRTDDDQDFVRKKLDIFYSRTTPLLDHYRHKGVRIVSIEIGIDTGPPDIVAQIDI